MNGFQIMRPLNVRRANALLVVLGILSLILCGKGVNSQEKQHIVTFAAGALVSAVPYFLAAWIALRAPASRSTLIVVLLFAATFRLMALQTTPFLSTDLYRYIWDGRVQAAGINPYRYLPSDEHLSRLRDAAIYPHINRPGYAKTLYPPIDQAVFLAATRISETPAAIRLTFIFCEALALWALGRLLMEFGLPAHRVLLYAWHPLPIWEFASGGHVDALLIAFLSLTLLAHRRGWQVGTGLALACAMMTKLFPVVLFPALYRRWGWKMPTAFVATAVAAYAPYVATYNLAGVLGFLPGYTSEEGLRSGERFYLINLLPAAFLHSIGLSTYGAFVGIVLLAFTITGAWALWGGASDEKHYIKSGLALATIFTAALSSSYSWYYSWLVPFLCLLPYPWLFWLTASPMILYLNWLHFGPTNVFLQNSAIYLPTAFLGLWQLGRPWVRRLTFAMKDETSLPGTALAEDSTGV